jgi:glycosyltransferase involved in cell wall biosynthesis
MDSPLISIIIPTCGRPEMCLRAVQSALSQTYREIEVIVVNDGADAATAEVLRRQTDPRLKVIELLTRMGGSFARNRGFEASQGELIAFLDDDDEWFEHKLERQLNAINHAPNPTNTIISSRVIRQTCKTWAVIPQTLYNQQTPLAEYLFCLGSIYDARVMTTSTFLLSRSLFSRISFCPNLKKHDDWDFALRANVIHHAEIRIVPEPLVIWHHDHDHPHVGSVPDWRFSFNWMKNNSQLFTPISRVAFLLTVVAPPPTRLPWILYFVAKNRSGITIPLIWYVILCRKWALHGSGWVKSTLRRLGIFSRRHRSLASDWQDSSTDRTIVSQHV